MIYPLKLYSRQKKSIKTKSLKVDLIIISKTSPDVLLTIDMIEAFAK